MNNNAPDYNENLVFEPEMTWEELCKWVKDNYDETIIIMNPELINIGYVQFRKTGEIIHDFVVINNHRTYEQMKTIIEALWG